MFRVRSRGAHDVTATHAKADGSHAAAPHALCAVEKFQDGTGVVHDHLVTELRPRLYLAERLPFQAIYRNGPIVLVSKFEMYPFAIAVVEVRDHAVVPDCADAPSDIVEFLAHTPNIHVNDHGRKGSVLFRVRDKRLHHSCASLDLDELFLHPDTFKGFCHRPQDPRQEYIRKRPGNNPLSCISLFRGDLTVRPCSSYMSPRPFSPP